MRWLITGTSLAVLTISILGSKKLLAPRLFFILLIGLCPIFIDDVSGGASLLVIVSSVLTISLHISSWLLLSQGLSKCMIALRAIATSSALFNSGLFLSVYDLFISAILLLFLTDGVLFSVGLTRRLISTLFLRNVIFCASNMPRILNSVLNSGSVINNNSKQFILSVYNVGHCHSRGLPMYTIDLKVYHY